MNQNCGIYCIINKLNGKRYVGKSKNLKNRFKTHKNDLRRNVHHSSHLQYAWNKYSEENFDFCVLEFCNEEELSTKEMEYMKVFKSTDKTFGYNMVGNEQLGVLYTPDTIYNMRMCRRNNIPIVQLTVDGELVNRWHGAREASGSGEFLQSCIRTCLSKISSVHNGYVWISAEEYDSGNFDVEEHFKSFRSPRYRKIVQLDNEYDLIKIFGTVKEASEETGIHLDSISMCCRRLCINAGGFRWEYYHNYLKGDFNKNKKHMRDIIKLSIDMEFICEYGSLREATESIGRLNSSISYACKDIKRSAYGFRWMYKEDYLKSQKENYEKSKEIRK